MSLAALGPRGKRGRKKILTKACYGNPDDDCVGNEKGPKKQKQHKKK
jgi:hypothetical protein